MVKWLPGSSSPYGYSRQPVLSFYFFIFSLLARVSTNKDCCGCLFSLHVLWSEWPTSFKKNPNLCNNYELSKCLQNSKKELTLCKPHSFGTDNKRPLKSDIRLIKSQIKEVAKAGTNSRGMFYQGVRTSMRKNHVY